MRSILFVVCLCVLLAGPVMAEPVENGAEQIVLNGGRFGDVLFTHKQHQDALGDCETCHRLFPEAPGSIEKLRASGTLKPRQVMNDCTACHFDRTKKERKSGPTSCSGCHRD